MSQPEMTLESLSEHISQRGYGAYYHNISNILGLRSTTAYLMQEGQGRPGDQEVIDEYDSLVIALRAAFPDFAARYEEDFVLNEELIEKIAQQIADSDNLRSS